MAAAAGGLPPNNQFSQTVFTVTARISPGLFRLNLDGKGITARTALDLTPGKQYQGQFRQIGPDTILQIQRTSTDASGVPHLIQQYREKADVPDNLLSRIILGQMVQQQRPFQAGAFRQLYLQLQWLYPQISNSGEPREPRQLPGIAFPKLLEAARFVSIMQDKGLSFSDDQLKMFLRAMGVLPEIRHTEPDAGRSGGEKSESGGEHGSGNHSRENSQGGEYSGKDGERHQESRDEELWNLVQQFNASSAGVGTGSRSGVSKNAAWMIIPLANRDNPEQRGFLRYNSADKDEAVSVRVGEWFFAWYENERGTMYFQFPGESEGFVASEHVYPAKNVSFIKDQLKKTLKGFTFNEVMELSELMDSDGFSLSSGMENIFIRRSSD